MIRGRAKSLLKRLGIFLMKHKTNIYYKSFQPLYSFENRRNRIKQEEKKQMADMIRYVSNHSDFREWNEKIYTSRSHADGYVVYAASTYAVGCDVEKVRRSWSCDEIRARSNYFLDPMNQQLLFQSDDVCKSLIAAWTRKESYFKVNQTFACKEIVNITDLSEILTLKKMKFITKEVADDIILTCYTHLDANVNFTMIE